MFLLLPLEKCIWSSLTFFSMVTILKEFAHDISSCQFVAHRALKNFESCFFSSKCEETLSKIIFSWNFSISLAMCNLWSSHPTLEVTHSPKIAPNNQKGSRLLHIEWLTISSFLSPSSPTSQNSTSWIGGGVTTSIEYCIAALGLEEVWLPVLSIALLLISPCFPEPLLVLLITIQSNSKSSKLQ